MAKCLCGRYTTLDILCVFCLNGTPDFGFNEKTGLDDEAEPGPEEEEVKESK